MDRRKFLTVAGGAVALNSLLERPRILEAAPQAATELGRVKIRDVKTATIKIKYDAHLVKVTTDSGLYGIGEAYNRAGVVDHVNIIQPDTQKCGGLLEMKRIADWADMYFINMLCHNMCSPVGTIASGHACAATRSFVALESDSVELKYWPDIIEHDGPIYKDGYLELPDKPGLGIELNEQVCRKHLSPGSGFFE